MDSHALTLSKKDDSWQADIPAHKPGPAIITIIGKHYGQPFTKSLNYMVDRPLTRDAEQGPTYEVRFNTVKGSEAPDPQQVSYPYGRVQRPSPNPVREGYQFDGWFIGKVAYDFSKPVTEDFTLTAHWTPNKQNSQWRIDPNKGSQLGNETTTISPPGIRSGIKFSQVSSSIGPGSSDNFSLAVGSDGNAYAWGLNQSGQLGDGTETDKNKPVMVKMPDRTTYPDLPETCRSAPETSIRWPWAVTDTCTPGDSTTSASSAMAPSAGDMTRILCPLVCATPPAPPTLAKG